MASAARQGTPIFSATINHISAFDLFHNVNNQSGFISPESEIFNTYLS
jgi:hypothetical protein